MPDVGDVVEGKYRLDALVGSGGMGVVYAATHLALLRPVALKFVRHDPEKKGDGTARLVREARALANLASEHAARVQDVGLLDDGSPYLVMELLEGTTLDSVVRSEGPMSVGDATLCIVQACHALGEAHALGIVHRDVKPSNLFQTRDAHGDLHVKVIDFGISRARFPQGEATTQATRTGVFLGSPPFMSPEQVLEAKDVDARSDVWSLGVVLYFLLTGGLPFVASSLLELMTRIAYEEPPPLGDARPDLPDGLAAVVSRCLRKAREERFASAAELAESLVPYAPPRARVIAERIVRSVVAPVPRASRSVAPTTESGGETTESLPGAIPPPRRRRSIRAAAIGAGLAILGVAAVVVVRPRPAPVTTSAPPLITAAPEARDAAEARAAAPEARTSPSAQEDHRPPPSEPAAPKPAPRAGARRSTPPSVSRPKPGRVKVVTAPATGRPDLPTTPD